MNNLIQRLTTMRRPGNSIESFVAELKATASDGHLEALKNVIATEPDLIKCEALDVLRFIDEPCALDQARVLLGNDNEDVRRAVSEILGEMAGPESEHLLLQLLAHEASPDVRCSAVGALRMMGTLASLSALSEIISHDTSSDFEGRPISKLATAAMADIQSRFGERKDSN